MVTSGRAGTSGTGAFGTGVPVRVGGPAGFAGAPGGTEAGGGDGVGRGTGTGGDGGIAGGVGASRVPVVPGDDRGGGEAAAAYAQERALAEGHAYGPEQIYAVLDLQATYLQAIGAVGDPVEDETSGS